MKMDITSVCRRQFGQRNVEAKDLRNDIDIVSTTASFAHEYLGEVKELIPTLTAIL